MADRRTRPNADQRRLIADRSAKSLRLLAAPLRIYHVPSGGHGAQTRRSVNLTRYLTAPPDEMDVEEDDDEFDSMLGSAASAAEGARINADVYDFGSHAQRWPLPSSRRLQTAPSTVVTSAGSEETRDPPTPPLHSPPIPSRSGPWPSSSLFRQPSIRRPVRSRMVDFNEFTSRRRSTIRQLSRSESSSDDPRRPISPWDPPPQDEPSASIPAPQMARRFFGLSRNRRHESNGSALWSESFVENPDSPDEPSPYFPPDVSISRAWFPMPTPSSSSSSQSEVEGVEEREQRAPRLRRGGLRAPEAMLSRHASPEQDSTVTTIHAPTVIRMPASPVSENGHDDGANVAASDRPDAGT